MGRVMGLPGLVDEWMLQELLENTSDPVLDDDTVRLREFSTSVFLGDEVA